MSLALLVLFTLTVCTHACTNFLVTPRASADGSSMISYNTDSHTTYGELLRFPAAQNAPGTMRKIYDWETGVYLGEIPEAPVTYSVVGNINEFQLAIGETTFGGLEQLGSQPGAIIDYGSLIYIALQRSKTAREAIKVMTTLVEQYGYASEGESFSIADPTEVWILEMIGKGKHEKGAVWVARRIPDGLVSAHANQARITTFPFDDPDNCTYAPDVIKFAKAQGFYPASSPDSQFSFSDTYNPLSFEGARACEARVWSFFSKITQGTRGRLTTSNSISGMGVYLDYAQGYNLTNRMPLWVEPTQPLQLKEVIDLMRDHYENTWFDFRYDIGAEAFNAPYRWRPLDWKVADSTYINERSISTQQTGMTFVAHLRGYLPDPIGGTLWFGVDDSALTVHAPIWCGITDIPPSLKEIKGVMDMMTFSFDSSFWIFNLVSNYVYTRYNLIYPEVYEKILQLEDEYMAQAGVVEKAATQLWNQGDKQGVSQLLTRSSLSTYASLHDTWSKYFQYLFVKYMDGNVKTPTGNPKNPNVQFPGYGDRWYSRIAKETGNHYKEPQQPARSTARSGSPGRRRKL